MKRDWTKILERLEKPSLIVAAAAGLTLILMSLDFTLLESHLYDLRVTWGGHPKADPRIALVAVDDATVAELNEFSPLSLDFHARFLEALEKIHPTAIGYLVDLNRVNQANPELFNGEWGKRFVDAAGRLENERTPIVLGTPFDVTGEVVPPYPLSSLGHSVAIIHKDGTVFAGDKVTRRALTTLYDHPVFHTDLAARIEAATTVSPKGSYAVNEVDGSYFFFRYHGETSSRGKLPYPIYSFKDVLSGRAEILDALRDKIILVGTLTKEDSGDYAYTPYSKASYSSPKLIVHANILDSLLNHQSITRVPGIVNWVATFFIALFVFAWVMKSTPLTGLAGTLALALAYAAVTFLLFSWKGFWIRQSQPLVAVFFGYYLVVPYRLIVEYKKRWDFQQQNELLLQVEQLKTNFMQLVTHDLKTPVARIQGLTEVILRKADERLIDRDKESLNSILLSTDELNRFINSILELSRIESNRLNLSQQSKDVNLLVENAVEGFKASARAKQIHIEMHLEPLFPIRIDANLISKVLNNLLDNAVKYSPPNSVINVLTKELGGFVEITIQDQGIGMSDEELANLFTRFYRAKNDATTQIAGTGLGLYLSRFFVEAHEGRLEVKSSRGQGTTFTLFLPLIATSVQPPAGLATNLLSSKIQSTKEKSHV